MNDVNTMLYACAKIVESKLGVKPEKKRKPDKNKKPKWKVNIEKEIETMRREMSILSEIVDKVIKIQKQEKSGRL